MQKKNITSIFSFSQYNKIKQNKVKVKGSFIKKKNERKLVAIK